MEKYTQDREQAVAQDAQPVEDSTCAEWMLADFVPRLVSVIIPTYNREKMVVEAIRSALEQTYENVEVIVVDDGSTDNTGAVVESLRHGPKGDKVRYFRQENKGPGPARNLGLVESRGEFIQFLDSDDLLLPAKLESQVRIMQACARVDVVFSRVRHQQGSCASDEDLVSGCERLDPMEALLAGELNSCIHGPLWRRGICVRAGPWKNVHRWEDWECYTRYLLACSGWRFTDEVLAVYRRMGQERICTTTAGREFVPFAEAGIRLMIAEIQKLPRIPGRWKEALASHFFHQGRYALLHGATDPGRRLLRSALALASAKRLRAAIMCYRIAGHVLGWGGAHRVGRALKPLLRLAGFLNLE